MTAIVSRPDGDPVMPSTAIRATPSRAAAPAVAAPPSPPPPRHPRHPAAYAFTLPSVSPVRQYRWSTVISTISGTTDRNAPPTVYW